MRCEGVSRIYREQDRSKLGGGEQGVLLNTVKGFQVTWKVNNFINLWGCCPLWFWGSASNHLHNAEFEVELLMLLVGCWLRWPGDCGRSRLTTLLLERLLGVFAFHWSSLDGACCSVKHDEARNLIWLVPTEVFADLLLSLVTLRLPERTARTLELHCSN
jgi:hypothetical protein